MIVNFPPFSFMNYEYTGPQLAAMIRETAKKHGKSIIATLRGLGMESGSLSSFTGGKHTPQKKTVNRVVAFVAHPQFIETVLPAKKTKRHAGTVARGNLRHFSEQVSIIKSLPISQDLKDQVLLSLIQSL